MGWVSRADVGMDGQSIRGDGSAEVLACAFDPQLVEPTQVYRWFLRTHDVARIQGFRLRPMHVPAAHYLSTSGLEIGERHAAVDLRVGDLARDERDVHLVHAV